MKRWRSKQFFAISFFALIVFAAGGFTYGSGKKVNFVRGGTATSTDEGVIVPVPEAPRTKHVATPVPMKAIYMSQCVVGTPSFRKELVDLIDTTELNSVVIDIRDYTGMIAFPTDNPILADMVSDACGANDMKAFIEMLHEKNIYVIGRITVFQNPYYTKQHPEEAVQHVNGGVWKDRKGLAFVDVGSRPYWKTVVELAKESYEIGFDEINFDYIRFPSDGDMKAAVYSHSLGKNKADALEEFFKYLHGELEPTGMVMSADLFGYTTIHYDDLGIGQLLEKAMPYFDYIAPMVYPSHYNNGFAGLKNVNSDPGLVVYESMKVAVERAVSTTTSISSMAYTRIGTSTPAIYSKPSYPATMMRPWLQSFDYPVPYTPAMVKDQIEANEKAGLDSYYFWDPANKYKSLKAVLAPQ